MSGKSTILILATATMILSGCSMAVGTDKRYCQEHGADHADAGVCDDPWTIYQNRHALSDLASGNCGCGEK